MTRVVKLGGRAQQDPQLPAALALLCREWPGQVCLVHGGGDEVSQLQRRMGVEPRFVGGRRVTSAADLEVVRMVLSGTINKRLVSALLAHDVDAVGLSGEDAGLLAARPVAREQLGRVGEVTRVEPRVLAHLMAGGFVPVVSPLARDASGGYGEALNVNGDDAAAALAAALSADELLFLADVPGVLADGAVLAQLDVAQARALVADGVAAGGMAAKLQAAHAALASGVGSVRIGDIGAVRDGSRGTRITLSPIYV
ncbi:MAG TPA: acetylglutamate kinase [Gemmatimonadaceae bacterium]|jgi:acetylglutamate kinase|nr:acetylglutamate kinase [Gemmatimonadaceae bacterium]